MDQRFEGEVMQDLAAESPAAFSEESLDGMEGAEGEGFAEEDVMDELEAYDEGEDEALAMEEDFEADLGDEFDEFEAADELDVWDALEDVMADALDAEDADEFLRSLIGGLSGLGRVAGAIGRGARAAGRVGQVVGRAARTAGRVGRVAGRAGRVAGRAGRVAGRARRVVGRAQRLAGRVPRLSGGLGGVMDLPEDGEAPPSDDSREAPPPNPIGLLMQQLGQYLNQGMDEYEALEDLADLFAEEDLDEALPVLARVVARTAVRPVLRRAGGQISRPVRRQLVRSATQATQTLMRRRGPQAARALPRIAQSVGRTAARRGLRPAAVPQAMRRTAAQVAARPALVRRLAQPTVSPAARRPVGRGVPQRLRLRGPVEITIISR
jgi:hypothetical protein